VIKLWSFAHVLPLTCLFTFVELTLRRVQRSKVTIKLLHEGRWRVQMARYKGSWRVQMARYKGSWRVQMARYKESWRVQMARYKGSWCMQMARYKGGTCYKNSSLECKTQVKKILKYVQK
jgi:hypothetical protein